MTDRAFVDTNVILYSKDTRDPRKQQIADEIISARIRDASLVVSTQVLNEFYVNVTQKLEPGLSRGNAIAVCRSIAAVSCEPITEDTIEMGWDVQNRFSLSWWDSLIVSSAVLAGCDRLLTEDLQEGLVVDTIRIVNPFT